MFRIRQLGVCLVFLFGLTLCHAEDELTTSAEDRTSGDSTELYTTQSVGPTEKGTSEDGQLSTGTLDTSNGEGTATPIIVKPSSDNAQTEVTESPTSETAGEGSPSETEGGVSSTGGEGSEQTESPTSETVSEVSPNEEGVIDTETTEGVEATHEEATGESPVTEGSKLTEVVSGSTEGAQQETGTTPTVQGSSGNDQPSAETQTNTATVPAVTGSLDDGATAKGTESSESSSDGEGGVAVSTVATETDTGSSVGDASTQSSDTDKVTTGDDSDQTGAAMTSETPTTNNEPEFTTQAVPEKVNKTLTLTFDGDCSVVMESEANQDEFKAYIRTLLENILQENEVYITEIECGSIKVTAVVSNVNSDEDVVQDITNKLNSNPNITISFQNGNDTLDISFGFSGVEELPPPEELVTSNPVKKAKELTDIEMILIIVFGVIGCGIVLFVFCACVNACHQKRMTKSFELGSTPHTDALNDDFSLTKMERPKSNYDIEKRPYGQGRQDLYAYQSNNESIHEAETLQLPSRNSKGHDNPGYAKDEAPPSNGKTKGEGATAF